MKVGIYRVYYNQITEKVLDGKTVEVSHSSPVMEMVAAHRIDDLLAALPEPQRGVPGTTTRNAIVQIDQKHKNVILAEPPKGSNVNR